MCDPLVSHIYLFHLDACAGIALAPHDFVADVQKRLGKRSYAAGGGRRMCGTFLASKLEHGEICSTAEAKRGHCALCLHSRAPWGLEARGRGVSQRNREDSRKQHPGQLIHSSPLLSQDAARGSGCLGEILQCSNSTRGCSAVGFRPTNVELSKGNPRSPSARCRLSSKAKSCNRKLSFCKRLASHWRPWHPQSGWRRVVCGALCREGRCRAVQSQTL